MPKINNQHNKNTTKEKPGMNTEKEKNERKNKWKKERERNRKNSQTSLEMLAEELLCVSFRGWHLVRQNLSRFPHFVSFRGLIFEDWFPWYILWVHYRVEWKWYDEVLGSTIQSAAWRTLKWQVCITIHGKMPGGCVQANIKMHK